MGAGAVELNCLSTAPVERNQSYPVFGQTHVGRRVPAGYYFAAMKTTDARVNGTLAPAPRMRDFHARMRENHAKFGGCRVEWARFELGGRSCRRWYWKCYL